MVQGTTDINKAYPDPTSRRENIKHDWGLSEFQSRKLLPALTTSEGDKLNLDAQIVFRPKLNDRQYLTLEIEYSNRMDAEGYKDEDAGYTNDDITLLLRRTWAARRGRGPK